MLSTSYICEDRHESLSSLLIATSYHNRSIRQSKKWQAACAHVLHSGHRLQSPLYICTLGWFKQANSFVDALAQLSDDGEVTRHLTSPQGI